MAQAIEAAPPPTAAAQALKSELLAALQGVDRGIFGLPVGAVHAWSLAALQSG